ncbi:HD-GYP domain-containing protein [Caloranaerobacter azorensis]|uniref:HD-GYP domain-containing protein n=1 Tax=Caloranaerobacter azorensis TaxID=116090 RepID=A0A6P1YDJ8_9FIRM|nr:HD-GYP domain-containing protein [Caloranaerobacter azorensis]QIB26878.1 HD-GYP domain-containing protein [Caloranaerobacter azorensis]
MKLIAVESLTQGMRVAKPVYKSNGSVLLSEGMVIKDIYIQKLKALNIKQIYVYDDEDNQNIIKRDTRDKAKDLVKNVINELNVSSEVHIDEIIIIVNQIIEEILSKDELFIRLEEIRAVDEYTFGHSVNVSVLSIITGACLGYTKEKLKELGIGAMLHDIGKVRVPNSILNKPDKLTKQEFHEIKKHTIYGYEILKTIKDISETSRIIALYHHERVDGQGYPLSIKGDEIHEFAKIVSIADVYDALTSDRVYKKRIKNYQAVEYLLSMRGHQFDYNITKIFINNIALYSIGEGVILNTGEKGVVIKVNRDFPTRPVIRILYDSKGDRLAKPTDVDLMFENSKVIIDTVDDIE